MEIPLNEEKPYLMVLNIIKKACKGIPLTISKEWAKLIIKDFKITLEERGSAGDLWGEKSALFEYEGEIIRLKKEGSFYRLFHGDWESDPHWTGD